MRYNVALSPSFPAKEFKVQIPSLTPLPFPASPLDDEAALSPSFRPFSCWFQPPGSPHHRLRRQMIVLM